MNKPVAIVMGSDSDWPTMQDAANVLDECGIEYEVDVVSAHRTPQEMLDFALLNYYLAVVDWERLLQLVCLIRWIEQLHHLHQHLQNHYYRLHKVDFQKKLLNSQVTMAQ